MSGPTPDELAAAKARAEAAEAKAAAAQAAAEAAAARAAVLEAELAARAAGPSAVDVGTPAGSEPAGGESAAGPDAAPAGGTDEESGWPAQVAAAYGFDGPTLPVGALVETESAHPEAQVQFPLAMLNRHGLVAGATGTGKTKTLQVLTEGLSAAGVPVFVADIKGDLSGLAAQGTPSDALQKRTASIGQDWTPTAFPVEFYSLGGIGTGTPIRTTVTDFGPLLLAKVLGLNATQESSLGLIFHWADTQGLALLDLKDLQATIAFLLSDDGKAELKGIGGLSAATAGVILRQIVTLQAQGADAFFGEPAFATADLLRTTTDGRGVVSALELPAVQDRPALFSTFLMWLLADLFSELPEVGDTDKPRLVFFFDEAHLLFTGASKAFLTQVTQTVRLIRSKGVGVFFVTQTPKDVPADVLAQLGNRIQHALRAHTPDDAAALRATARTFPHTHYDLEELLTTLRTGEALVTVLSEKGAPTPVVWTRLRAPASSMDPLDPATMTRMVTSSPQHAAYANPIDRESAHELLAERAARAEADAAEAEEAEARAKGADRAQSSSRRQTSGRSRSTSRRSSPVDSFLRSAGTALGREITRSIFGTRRR